MAISLNPFIFLRRQAFKLVYPAQIFYNSNNKNFQKLHNDFYKTTPSEPDIVKTQLFFNIDSDLKSDGILSEGSPPENKQYIDAALISHKKSEMYLIHCDGNASCYEQMSDELEQFAGSGYNVIGFNPLGVGHSRGLTNGPEDYERAVAAIIENLILNGIPPENIILSGRSLGAAIVTSVAAKYQDNTIRLKVINDRSFARLDIAAASYVQSLIPTKLLRNTVGLIVYYTVLGLINVFNLNIDAKAAFTKINTANPGDAVCLCVDDDKIINQKASLAYNLDPEMQKFANRFICRGDYVDAHNIAVYGMYGPTVSLVDAEIKLGPKQEYYEKTAEHFIATCLQDFKNIKPESSVSIYEDQAPRLINDLIQILEATIKFKFKTSTKSLDSFVNKILEISDQLKSIGFKIDKTNFKESKLLNLIDSSTQLSDDILKAVQSKKKAIEAAIASDAATVLAENALAAVKILGKDPDKLELERAKFKAAQCQSFAAAKNAEAKLLGLEYDKIIKDAYKQIKQSNK